MWCRVLWCNRWYCVKRFGVGWCGAKFCGVRWCSAKLCGERWCGAKLCGVGCCPFNRGVVIFSCNSLRGLGGHDFLCNSLHQIVIPHAEQ